MMVPRTATELHSAIIVFLEHTERKGIASTRHSSACRPIHFFCSHTHRHARYTISQDDRTHTHAGSERPIRGAAHSNVDSTGKAGHEMKHLRTGPTQRSVERGKKKLHFNRKTAAVVHTRARAHAQGTVA